MIPYTVLPTHVSCVLAEAHWTSTWSSSLRHRRSFSEGVTALVTAAARWCGRCAGGEGALLAEGVVALLLLMLLAGVVSVAALSLSAARAWVRGRGTGRVRVRIGVWVGVVFRARV